MVVQFVRHKGQRILSCARGDAQQRGKVEGVGECGVPVLPALDGVVDSGAGVPAVPYRVGEPRPVEVLHHAADGNGANHRHAGPITLRCNHGVCAGGARLTDQELIRNFFQIL